MSFSLLIDASRVGTITHLVIGAVLLSLALFEVFDVDGSNLPTAAGATVVEAKQTGEFKQAGPRALAPATAPFVQPILHEGEILGPYEGFVVVPRSCPLQGPSRAPLPRANLPDPSVG